MDDLLRSHAAGGAAEGAAPPAELPEGPSGKHFFWPRSPRMRRLLDRARALAYDERPLLIQGERGAGKSALVGLMHAWAAREEGVLLTVRCREADNESVYRALAKAGRCAGSGRAVTVVLDEIATLPAALLESVISVLKRRATTLEGVSLAGIRLIAVTRRLAGALEGVPALEMIPLRERHEDIVWLAERFLRRKGEEDGKAGLAFTPRARHALLQHPWPGNLRELRIVAERAAVVCTGPEVDSPELALPVDGPEQWPRGYPSLREVERLYIERVVRESPTLEEAARVLAVDISTLWRKRRRYGL